MCGIAVSRTNHRRDAAPRGQHRGGILDSSGLHRRPDATSLKFAILPEFSPPHSAAPPFISGLRAYLGPLCCPVRFARALCSFPGGRPADPSRSGRRASVTFPEQSANCPGRRSQSTGGFVVTEQHRRLESHFSCSYGDTTRMYDIYENCRRRVI